MELTISLWIFLAILGLLGVVLWRWQYDRLRINVLEAAHQVSNKPMLIFDERHRLLYLSPGLVLFNRQSSKRLSRQIERPMPGREGHGEVEVDGNRYLYRSKLLEYKPGHAGVVVYLEFRQRSAAN